MKADHRRGRCGQGVYFARGKRSATLLAVAAFGCSVALAAASAPGAVSWTGAGGTSWGTGGSWSNGTGPGTGDTASFGDTGSSNLPGNVTSIVNADRTIGGLSFNDTIGHFHTLDLGTHALTITGILSFNLDQGQTTTTTIRNGALSVSGSFANIYAGRAVSGSSVGIADLSGLSSLDATVQNLLVGTSTAGSGTGTLTLSPLNTINAQLIQVGASNNSGETNGTLHLGLSNTLLTGELDIGKDNSRGLVDIVNGGTFTLGSVNQQTILQIANQNTNTNNLYSGTLDMGNAAVNLHLDSLVVAEKNGGSGGTVGQLIGGGSGSVTIGDPTARGNIYVAYTVNGGGTQGTADFSHLNSFQAYVNDVLVGNAPTGAATGSLSLAANSTVDASNNIIVGASGDGGNTLTLGQTTTIDANQFSIGKDYANGLVVAPSGSTLNLGSSGRHVALLLANSNATTNTTYTGKLDLTGATLNGYLSSLIVGQRQGGGGGSAVGTLVGATGGSVEIGDPANPGNFIVGNALGSFTSGMVDFSGLDSLKANVDTFSMGTSAGGSAQGTVKLAADNTITATDVIVGSGGDNSDSLALGHTNTILANQLIIGKDYSNGIVTIPSGGTLHLGSPAQRTSMFIANGNTNTNNTYSGTFDMTNATLVAYLDNVIIGTKNPLPGGELATFTTSNHADNYVEANSISIGGNQSTGIFNFGGGTLYAGSIAAGTGNPSFNWTGGRLSVRTFGTAAIPFNLNNQSTGTLAPGSASNPIGTTQVWGNYTQGSAGTMDIEIAGNSPGSGNDQIAISGNATLGGTLKLHLINGFTPAVGQNYLIATYASHSGKFGFVAPPTMPADVAFQLDDTSNSTQLMIHTVAPTAQSWISTAASGLWSDANNWSTHATPITSSSLSIVNSGVTPQTVTVDGSTTVHRVALEGASASLDLEVPQGIKLGVANELDVGFNAILSGGGEVVGNVFSTGGIIAPGDTSSILTVDGNVQAGSASLLLLALAGTGPAQHNLLQITGNLNVAGALQVTIPNGFVPGVGESFNVLDFGSFSGQFSHIYLPGLPSGMMWDTSNLSKSGAIAVVVPEPELLGLLSLTALGLLGRRRRNRASKDVH